jgi:DNA-binding NarL/FixJ family response regulator
MVSADASNSFRRGFGGKAIGVRRADWKLMAQERREGEGPSHSRTENRESQRSLSPREIEVLTWAARGKSASQIAAMLRISKRTVDEHARAAASQAGRT